MNINKLNELVNSSKLNKIQIAERCGISRTTLDNVLSGSDARISTIERIACVLNVPVCCFFDDPISNTATANGDKSIAAINSTISMEKSKAMEEKLNMMEKLLEEKERLINVLMQRDNKQ